MLLRDVMTRHVDVIHPDATLSEAAEKMKQLDIGPLPVCDGERLVGMITDRDITVRATAEGQDPNQIRVRDVMSPGITYCYEDQDIREAARIMQEKQFRRLVVLNRDKRLVGIVSMGDLAVHAGERELSDDELSETLAGVSEPSEPAR